MALLIYPILGSDSFFTSALEEILITTNQPYCDVLIEIEDESVTLLDSRYYTCDGRITVHGVRELIESYMLSHSTLMHSISFQFNDGDDPVGNTPLVFYCSQVIDTYIDPQTFNFDHCLTAFPVQLASHNTPVPISFYTDQYTLNLQIHYVYRNSQGEIKYYDTPQYIRRGVSTYGIFMFDASYKNCFDYLKVVTDVSEVLAVSFTDGQHTATVYFTAAPTRTFLYMNRFSVWEVVSIPCSTTTKTETDFATALCNELILHYDVRHQQTFDVQTPVLSRDLANQINEMLTSSEVRLADGYVISEMKNIVITDYTSELSDSPRATNSIKFTWQFQDRRLRQALPATVPQIFTTQFNYPFS